MMSSGLLGGFGLETLKFRSRKPELQTGGVECERSWHLTGMDGLSLGALGSGRKTPIHFPHRLGFVTHS